MDANDKSASASLSNEDLEGNELPVDASAPQPASTPQSTATWLEQLANVANSPLIRAQHQAVSSPGKRGRGPSATPALRSTLSAPDPKRPKSNILGHIRAYVNNSYIPIVVGANNQAVGAGQPVGQDAWQSLQKATRDDGSEDVSKQSLVKDGPVIVPQQSSSGVRVPPSLQFSTSIPGVSAPRRPEVKEEFFENEDDSWPITERPHTLPPFISEHAGFQYLKRDDFITSLDQLYAKAKVDRARLGSSSSGIVYRWNLELPEIKRTIPSKDVEISFDVKPPDVDLYCMLDLSGSDKFTLTDDLKDIIPAFPQNRRKSVAVQQVNTLPAFKSDTTAKRRRSGKKVTNEPKKRFSKGKSRQVALVFPNCVYVVCGHGLVLDITYDRISWEAVQKQITVLGRRPYAKITAPPAVYKAVFTTDVMQRKDSMHLYVPVTADKSDRSSPNRRLVYTIENFTQLNTFVDHTINQTCLYITMAKAWKDIRAPISPKLPLMCCQPCEEKFAYWDYASLTYPTVVMRLEPNHHKYVLEGSVIKIIVEICDACLSRNRTYLRKFGSGSQVV